MAKYPRSNRKLFEIVKNDYPVLKYTIYFYSNYTRKKYLEGFAKTKSEAKRYVVARRKALKEREWHT